MQSRLSHGFLLQWVNRCLQFSVYWGCRYSRGWDPPDVPELQILLWQFWISHIGGPYFRKYYISTNGTQLRGKYIDVKLAYQICTVPVGTKGNGNVKIEEIDHKAELIFVILLPPHCLDYLLRGIFCRMVHSKALLSTDNTIYGNCSGIKFSKGLFPRKLIL